ncbi:MAG: hypothetical protein E7291_02995 [Lachnospiraceae bacterium]|nr:hypothetical protein [Lachnospiraceae bacterium]
MFKIGVAITNALALLTDGSSSVLDDSVVTFIINSAKEVLSIITTPPLGIFITIGIIGSVVGLVSGIVHMVRKR